MGASRNNRVNLQTGAILHLGGVVTGTPDMSVEIARRTRACWMRTTQPIMPIEDRLF